MNWIHKYLDIRFEKHLKKWDTVIAICGKEGVGKSNLALNMLEYWQTKLNGECKDKDIRHMCMTKLAFVKDLSTSNKNDMVIFDEAGELSSRRAMTKFNTTLIVGYQIIRADTLFTILIIPDVLYLDTYFRNTRVKHMIHVYQRGKCRLFLNKNYRMLLALNEGKRFFNYNAVKPNFYDKFPVYSGVMAKAYEKMKEKKTTDARRKLIDGVTLGLKKEIVKYEDIPPKLLREAQVEALLKANIKQIEMSRILDIPKVTIHKTVKEVVEPRLKKREGKNV